MPVRDMVKIDEEKCDGCGQCATACAEGAIEIVDGKARLISDVYCDGLGACLGECPQDAITIEKRKAADFNEKAVEKHLSSKPEGEPAPVACPGSSPRTIDRCEIVGMHGEPGEISVRECLSYVLSLPVHCVAVGCTTIGQLEDDVRCAQQFKPLSAEEMNPLRDRAKDLAGPYLEDWKRNTQARASAAGVGRAKHG